MNTETILAHAEALSVVGKHLKQCSMTYQFTTKVEIARLLGVHWQALDLPFREWDRIHQLHAEGRLTKEHLGWTCPRCRNRQYDFHDRQCPVCSYSGDWIQPGEVHLYQCTKGVCVCNFDFEDES